MRPVCQPAAPAARAEIRVIETNRREAPEDPSLAWSADGTRVAIAMAPRLVVARIEALDEVLC